MSGRSRSKATEIVLVDDLEKCEKDVLESLLNIPDGGECRLVINSGGGSVYSGLSIAHLIEMKQLRATAVVLADCSSSAVLVYAACKERQVAPHASFLFHPMQWSSEERSRLSGATGWANEFKRIDRVCADWICEHLGLSPSRYRQWVSREVYITAEEMVRLGLATYIPHIEGNIGKATKTSRTTTRSRKGPGVVKARILPAARHRRPRRVHHAR